MRLDDRSGRRPATAQIESGYAAARVVDQGSQRLKAVPSAGQVQKMKRADAAGGQSLAELRHLPGA